MDKIKDIYTMKYECKHCMNIGDNKGHDEYRKKYPEATHCMFCGRFVKKNEYNKLEEPAVVEVTGPGYDKGETEESHPAYAQLYISRGSGGHENLYGSSVRNHHTITLRISRSVKHSSAYDESYFDDSIPLIEVQMSQAQFAEAITSLNLGGGVPVTLRSIRGQYMPNCGEISKSQKANDDLKMKMKEFADRIVNGHDAIETILSKKGAINKGERAKISSFYGQIRSELISNLPFLHECMTESYEKTISNAKAEIEAFYTHGLQRLGIEQLDTKNIAVNESGRLYYQKDDVVEVDYKENE